MTTEIEIRALVEEALREVAVDGSLQSTMGAGSDDIEGARAYLRALAAGGWVRPTWPREYGGRGASADEAAEIANVLSTFRCPDLYPFMVGLDLVGPTLLEHGEPHHKERWLGRIADGSDIWCQMFSEPAAGSDLANVATRARRTGDEWVITGQKVWTSRAMYADFGFCLARTDPDVPKHQGMTMFVIPMAAAGVDVRPLRQMNGDQHFSEVFLDDVRIPDSHRVGQVGAGWKVAITVLLHERNGMQSRGLDTAEEVRPLVPGWLSDLARRQLLGDPVLRDRAVQVLILERLNQLAQERARASSNPSMGSGVKLRSSRLFRERAELIKDAQGLAGLLDDSWGNVDWLTAPSMSIRGGTDEIQHNIIGERILGLAGEPRVDRDRPWSETREVTG